MNAADALPPGLYPARIWPANILRAHVVFPCAMDTWRATEHVALVDAEGNEREGVFVDLDHGLWSPCGHILTLLLHPGRVKSGLAASADRGPALQVGERLRLRVGRGLRLADGRSLRRGRVFPITVAPAVRTPLSGEAISLDATGVRLASEAPMDVLGVLTHVRLTETDDAPMPVRIRAGADAVRLRLRRRPHGAVRLTIDPALEDCCGNRLADPFERVVREPRRLPAA